MSKLLNLFMMIYDELYLEVDKEIESKKEKK